MAFRTYRHRHKRTHFPQKSTKALHILYLFCFGLLTMQSFSPVKRYFGQRFTSQVLQLILFLDVVTRIGHHELLNEWTTGDIVFTALSSFFILVSLIFANYSYKSLFNRYPPFLIFCVVIQASFCSSNFLRSLLLP